MESELAMHLEWLQVRNPSTNKICRFNNIDNRANKVHVRY